MREMVLRPALRNVMIGGALAGFGITAISQFMPLLLVRTHGLTIGEAAQLYGVISGISLSVGLLLGALGTDWASRHDRRWPAWGAVIGLTLSPIVYILALLQTGVFGAAAFLMIGGATVQIFYGPTLAMIQNLVGMRVRASAAALFGMLFAVVGAGLGPTFVGFASDRFAAAAFPFGDYLALCPGGRAEPGATQVLSDACLAAASNGLRSALVLAVLPFFWAAFHFFLASRPLRGELARVAAEQTAAGAEAA
jgi:MFS family permease